MKYRAGFPAFDVKFLDVLAGKSLKGHCIGVVVGPIRSSSKAGRDQDDGRGISAFIEAGWKRFLLSKDPMACANNA